MGHLNRRIPAQATLYRLAILAHDMGVSVRKSLNRVAPSKSEPILNLKPSLFTEMEKSPLISISCAQPTTHYSLKWATDKFRWRAFGALPTIRASPEGPPIGRLRMAVCPCPVEGPGGVATGGARRSGRLIGNCRAQAPRPGNVGVAGRGSDRPTDWRIPPWHHLECRKPSSGSMSGNRPTGHASRPGTARYC